MEACRSRRQASPPGKQPNCRKDGSHQRQEAHQLASRTITLDINLNLLIYYPIQQIGYI